MKTFRLPITGPAIWRVNLGRGSATQAQAWAEANAGYVRQFVEGQRRHVDTGVVQLWRKSMEVDNLKVTYINRFGQEIIMVEPTATPIVSEEYITGPNMIVSAPKYLFISVDPVAMFRKPDIVTSTERCYAPPPTGSIYPFTLTDKWVSKIRYGWTTAPIDMFATAEQIDAFHQSFVTGYPANGQPHAAGGVGTNDLGAWIFGAEGTVEITGIPDGSDVTIDPSKYSTLGAIQYGSLATVPDYRMFYPHQRLWQASPGGHPCEEARTKAYNAIDLARARQGLPPGDRDDFRYTEGTSVTMQTTWLVLDDSVCIGYSVSRGWTCVTQMVATINGEVPSIVFPEYGSWPISLTVCRQNNLDGSVEPPPSVATDQPTVQAAVAALSAFDAWGDYGQPPSKPNEEYPGVVQYKINLNQPTDGDAAPAACFVNQQWDFSGVTAKWRRSDGKLSANYRCTGYGNRADRWANACDSIFDTSPLQLVLSRV